MTDTLVERCRTCRGLGVVPNPDGGESCHVCQGTGILPPTRPMTETLAERLRAYTTGVENSIQMEVKILREAANAIDAQDERIKEVERLRDIAVMNKEEGDDIHAQEYNALLARADAAEKALAEAQARSVALEEALRDAVNDAHGTGLIRDHPEGTSPFAPTTGGSWKLCPNVVCSDARALLSPSARPTPTHIWTGEEAVPLDPSARPTPEPTADCDVCGGTGTDPKYRGLYAAQMGACEACGGCGLMPPARPTEEEKD